MAETGISYDLMGNIQSLTRDGHAISYTYDSDKQLTSVSGTGVQSGTYSYDGNGNVVNDGSNGFSFTKFGKQGDRQRYRCKDCKRTQLQEYLKQAYHSAINKKIAIHIKEGCGIRSISRLLNISANTVLSCIKIIANSIQKPLIAIGRKYQVDELKTYIKNKTDHYWVICALDSENNQVVDFKVGKRTKKNIKRVIDTLLLSGCKKINTDGLDIYRYVIPIKIHGVRRYGTNKIERKNLSLRTHLKRLNRKTICYTKNLLMLEACLKYISGT